MRFIVGMAAAALAVASVARANDSGSELAVGGLVLVKTPGIAMQREDLSLSPGQVRVRYEMRNGRGAPVTVRVAFPMPQIPRDTPGGMETSDGGNIDMDRAGSPNFVNFKITADGKEITPEVEVRAMLPGGRNIVDELRRIGGWRLVLQPRVFQLSDQHPAQPNVPATPPGQWDLDAATRAQLVTLGALRQDENGYETLWDTFVTFHWLQTFPPGITVIEHRYVPVLGFHLMAPKGGGWAGTDEAKAYCIAGDADKMLQSVYQGFMARRQREQPGQADDRYIPVYNLTYILHTAANWDGPIGTLHLMVNGGSIPRLGRGLQTGFASLCSDLPLHRIAPDRIEATATNYQPKTDLRVLMVPR